MLAESYTIRNLTGQTVRANFSVRAKKTVALRRRTFLSVGEIISYRPHVVGASDYINKLR